jgi:hypothetical protein
MRTVDYLYKPIFGIEKYLPPGNGIANDGGAEMTNDNLVISLWDEDLTQILIPIAEAEPGGFFTPPPPQYANLARSFMSSRVSARFYMEGSVKLDGMVAVINPPQEYKQRIAFAVERIGDIVADGADAISIVKPLSSLDSWWVKAAEADLEVLQVEEFESPESVGAQWSNFGGVPYVKTNGADGNPPEFITPGGSVSSNADVDKIIAAFNSGDFYILMEIGGIFDTSVISIEWPHSTGRN